MEKYVEGVSTEKVKEITEGLSGTSFSKGLASSLAGSFDAELRVWRSRARHHSRLGLQPRTVARGLLRRQARVLLGRDRPDHRPDYRGRRAQHPRKNCWRGQDGRPRRGRL